MNELFKLPERLPESPGKIPMFQATKFKTMSNRDTDFQSAIGRRLRDAQRSFNIVGNPANEGSRLVLRTEKESLELYCPSDSLWWAHHGLANQEKLLAGTKLPTVAKARELAAGQLERHKLDISSASVYSVTYLESDVKEGDAKPRSVRTAIDVNYRFALAEHPVMGPGAKIKVTFAGDGALAQLVYFWRKPSRAPNAIAISATTALERFMRDPAFFRLRNKEASVDVHKIAFGYYAMSPTDFQRLYVPVWAIDATCKTRELQHDFRRYVVAVDRSPEDVKRDSTVPDPRACRIF